MPYLNDMKLTKKQTIEADWGDEIEITVTSYLENNGTGVHWHGLRQLGSNEMDGTNGLTECPIIPGGTKVYRFKATQYGTSVRQQPYENHTSDSNWNSGIIHITQFSMEMVLSVPSLFMALQQATMISILEFYRSVTGSTQLPSLLIMQLYMQKARQLQTTC